MTHMHMQEIETETNTSELKKFLKHFQFKLVTISVQPEIEGAKVPQGKYFNAKNRVRAVPPELLYTEHFQAELQNCQEKGCAIYFLINEGNGEPTDRDNGNFNCGKRSNITQLKTLAIDTDEADFNTLWEKLKEIKLAPHFAVESSPGKYHVYFLIEPVKAEGEAILQWTALQKKLDDLIPMLDQSMAEINQVLRLPTFFNLKPHLEQPFKVKVFKNLTDQVPLYDLKFLYDRLEAHTYRETESYVNGHDSFKERYNKFEFPKAHIQHGERRNTICRYIEHLMENVLPITAKDEDYFVLVDAFIIKYLPSEEAAEFLQGGKRRQNIENYFRDQQAYRVKKYHAKEAIKASEQFDHIEAVADTKLPDTFYQSFPGDLGFITKEISNYAPNLPQELCFAGALAISGMLKAETFRFKGAWPFVNGIIVAGTGVGKSAIKDIAERALASVGLRGKYPQVLGFQNSVQSLHTSLYTAGGVGIIMIDESGDYLSTITSKNAPGYAKALKKYFKEATTGRDQGSWLHPGGSLSYTVPPIQGGMLSLWMLIQPDKFESSMSLEDMADGFLPRFFVFNGRSNIKLTRTFGEEERDYSSFKPSMDLQVYMESLVQKMPSIDTAKICEDAEAQVKALTPKAKIEVIRLAQRDAIYTARSEARNIGSNRVNVKIDDDARALVQSYLNEREKEANKIQSKDLNDPALGIYIRIEEMLLRLMCNAVSLQNGKAVIDFTLADACIKFHRFQTDRFFKNELAELSKGSGERDMETVIKGVRKAFMTKGKDAVKVSEIQKAIKNTKRPKNIGFIIEELLKRGLLIKELRPNSKYKDHKTPYYLPGEDDEL